MEFQWIKGLVLVTEVVVVGSGLAVVQGQTLCCFYLVDVVGMGACLGVVLEVPGILGGLHPLGCPPP